MRVRVELRKRVMLRRNAIVRFGGFTLGCGGVSAVPVGALHRVSEKKFTAVMSEFLCPFLHKLAHPTLFVGIADILRKSIYTRTVAFSAGAVEMYLALFACFRVRAFVTEHRWVSVQFLCSILQASVEIALHRIAQFLHVPVLHRQPFLIQHLQRVIQSVQHIEFRRRKLCALQNHQQVLLIHDLIGTVDNLLRRFGFHVLQISVQFGQCLVIKHLGAFFGRTHRSSSSLRL